MDDPEQQKLLPIAQALVEELMAAGFPPDALIDMSAILLQYWAACQDWKESGSPPDMVQHPSKQRVREALGTLAGILRTMGVM